MFEKTHICLCACLCTLFKSVFKSVFFCQFNIRFGWGSRQNKRTVSTIQFHPQPNINQTKAGKRTHFLTHCKKEHTNKHTNTCFLLNPHLFLFANSLLKSKLSTLTRPVNKRKCLWTLDFGPSATIIELHCIAMQCIVGSSMFSSSYFRIISPVTLLYCPSKSGFNESKQANDKPHSFLPSFPAAFRTTVAA